MIGIYLNSEFIDLGESTVRLEKVNAMFITDVYQGDYSFPFTVPATEKNLRILGFANRIEILNRTIDYNCDLYINGLFSSKAVIRVNAATRKNISFNLIGGFKSLSIADKKLSELDYGNNYFLGTDPASISTKASTISGVGDWRIYGFTFVPHYNPDFYGSANPAFQGTVNCVDCSNNKIRYNTTGTGNKYCIVPWLFLFFVLDKIFKAEGLTPKGTFWEDPESAKILLYNNRALDSPSIDYSTYVLSDAVSNHNQTSKIPLKNGPAGSFDNLGGWSNANSYQVVSANQVGQCAIDIDLTAYISNNLGYDGVYFVPTFRVMLDAVSMGEFNLPAYKGTTQNVKYTVYAYFGSGDIGKKLYVEYYHNHPGVTNPYPYPVVGVQPGTSMLITNLSGVNLNTYAPYVKFKDHVEDSTVSELLANVKKLGIDMIFDYGEGTVTLNKISEEIKAPIATDLTPKAISDYEISYDTKGSGFLFSYDFSGDGYADNNFKDIQELVYRGSYVKIEDLPAPSRAGDLAYVQNLNQYYIIAGSSGLAWEYYSDNYYPIKIGNGSTEIKAKLAPLFMGLHDNDGGANADENLALMPHIKQTGSSEMFGLGINDFIFRTCFYRGGNNFNSLPSPKGNFYVYAGTSTFGLNGAITGEMDLCPNVSNSIFNLWLNTWLLILNNGEIVERDFMLNEHEILNFDVSKPIISDTILFFVKSGSLILGKSLKPTRLKLLKIQE